MFHAIVSIPAGLFVGIVVLALGLVRTMVPRACFWMGVLLCAVFLGAVAPGYIR